MFSQWKLSHWNCKYNISGLNRSRCTIRSRPDIDGCKEDQMFSYHDECDNWLTREGLTKEQVLERIIFGD